MEINLTCPCCKGTGELKNIQLNCANLLPRKNQQKIAMELAAKGLSLRGIAKIMGYKSQGSIKYLLDK